LLFQIIQKITLGEVSYFFMVIALHHTYEVALILLLTSAPIRHIVVTFFRKLEGIGLG
jgi:hypothetical protein